jgi:hypothetical protein
MEKALDKFLKIWRSNNNVTGILLTGSYAINMNHKTSDIDIRIIFEKDCDTIKGLLEIDGFKFSYIARSYEKTENRIKSEFAINYKFEANVIRISKILFEKDSKATKLKEFATNYQQSKFLVKKKDRNKLKTDIYLLYNYKSYLLSLNEDSPYFIYTYMSFIKLSLRIYSEFLNFEQVTDLKTEKLFTNSSYKEKCGWEEFPDSEFSSLWQNCISEITKENVLKTFYYLENKIIKFNEKNYKIIWKE